jgi:hypothetical protein
MGKIDLSNENIGKMNVSDLQAVKDLAQLLVETYSEDDYKDMIPYWEVQDE